MACDVCFIPARLTVSGRILNHFFTGFQPGALEPLFLTKTRIGLKIKSFSQTLKGL
jgi:hypothetical protein